MWIQSTRALKAVRVSVPSLQVSVAMLQYCYGFNRLQLWLLAQGLLQSVPSLQVSVAMLYYNNYCYGFNRPSSGSILGQGLLQSVLSFQVSVAIPYYSIVMVSIGVSSGS